MFFRGKLALGLLGWFVAADRPEIKQDTDDVVTSPWPENSSALVLLNKTVLSSSQFVKWTTCSSDFVPAAKQPYVRNANGYDVCYHLFSPMTGNFEDAEAAKTLDTSQTLANVHQVQKTQCRSKYLGVVSQGGKVDTPFDANHIAIHAKYLLVGDQQTKFKELNGNLLKSESITRVYNSRPFLYGYVLDGGGGYLHLYNVYGEKTTNETTNEEAAAILTQQEQFRYTWMKLSNHIDGKSPQYVATHPVTRETTHSPDPNNNQILTDLWARWAGCNGFHVFDAETNDVIMSHSVFDGEKAEDTYTGMKLNFFKLQISTSEMDSSESVSETLSYDAAGVHNTICRFQQLKVVHAVPKLPFVILDSTDVVIHTEYEVPDGGDGFFEEASRAMMDADDQRDEKLFKQFILLKSTEPYNGNWYIHQYIVFDDEKKYTAHNESPEFLVWKGKRVKAKYSTDAHIWMKLANGLETSSPSPQLTFKRL